MSTDNKEALLKEYTTKRGLYKDFSRRLKAIIEDILNLEGLSYLSIEERAKSTDSLDDKLERVNVMGVDDIQDLAGVRVITYVYEDIDAVEKVIKENFIAEKLKVEEKLGVDRVGYRSHHWLISLPPERIKLPEYKRFKGLYAELQIRTIVQHAWAQIGHNQVYKPSAVLPEKITRDFSLLSGLLEIADNEFSRISNEIVSYQQSIEKDIQSKNLNITIDSISLRQYFYNHFKDSEKIVSRFGSNDNMTEEIIEELNKMGITTLRKLDGVVPKNLVTNIDKYVKETNYVGIIRFIMICHDAKTYFEKVWNKKWSFTRARENLYKHYGIDINSLKDNYGVSIIG